MFKGGVTKTAPPRVGGSERAKLCTSAGMKSSRSSTITTDSRFCRMKRSSSDDALTKPVLGSAASRLRKTVTSGAIAELSDNRACSASGVQSIKRCGIPTPREIPQTISRERLSLREQPKSLTAKKMVTSASTSSLSTLAKHSRGSIKSKGELMVSDKTLLESQVRELLAEAKTKESEISRLRMELQSHKELASPSEDAKPDMESDLQSVTTGKTELLVGELKEKNRLFQGELAALREENQTLKQRLITLENSANEASATNMSADNTNCLLSSNDPANMSTLTSTDSSELQSDSVCSARISVVEELKDRMQRMEESHHSTSEELQATLQELADQQQVVQELTAENERLLEEKSLLQTSLQQQRERLELLGQQNESVLQRLREVTQSQEAEASRVSRVAELEQRLTEQVESSRFEREKLVDLQQQLTESLRALEQEHQEAQNTLKGLKDEAKLLQDRLESERRATDEAVRKSEQQILTTEATVVENASLKAQLETERQRLSDLKAIQSTSDHTELQSLLKAAHEERDQMELSCAELRQELQQTSTRAQAAQASLDKAEADRRELQERMEQREHNHHANVFALEERSREAEKQLQDLKETIFELEDQVEQQRAVRLHTNQTVLDLENQISKQEESKSELERQMRAMDRQMKDDAEEWSRFQADLQTAVVVANDIKVEAQQELRSLRRRLQEEQEHSARLVSELDQIRRARAWPESSGRSDWTRAFLSQPEAVTSEDSGVGPEASVKFLIRSFDSPEPHGPMSSTPSPRSPLSVAPPRTAPAAAVSPIQRNVRVQPLSTSAERRVAFPGRGSCEDPKTLYLMRKSPSLESVIKTPSLFTSRTDAFTHHRAHSRLNVERTDPLCALAREYGGSKRNALLKWCQKKTQGYPNIDVTNFSSSWSDGLAFCALLHTYLPAHIPYPQLASHDKGRNLSLAFQAAESVGIKPSLDVSDLMQTERPDWQSVMQYVSLIYKYFET